MNERELKEALWNPSAQGGDAGLVFEQYRLCVQMADNTSERREKANKFFLALNGAVAAAAVPALGEYPDFFGAWQSVLTWAVLLVVVCCWGQIIRSYRKLNEAKFRVIGELEERLPARPYVKAEWGLLQEGGKRSAYWPLTFLEGKIPWAFALLYTMLFATHLAT